jgi:hypothetical protein
MNSNKIKAQVVFLIGDQLENTILFKDPHD